MVTAVATVFALVVVAAGPICPAGKSLRRAENLYKRAEYDSALATVDAGLLCSEIPPRVHVKLLRRRAFVLVLLGRTAEGRDTWRRLLAIRPDYQLNPVTTPPDFVALFGPIEPPTPKVKRPKADPMRTTSSEMRPARPATPMAPPPPIATSNCAPFLCALPFGVGQFSNGHTTKGVLFGVTQVALLATNISLYWTRLSGYDDTGRPTGTEDAAIRSYTIQLVSLGVFGAVWIAGAAEAYLSSP